MNTTLEWNTLGRALCDAGVGCVKRPHATVDDAIEHLKRLIAMNDTRGEQYRSIGLHVYRCPRCSQYHVGRERRLRHLR